MKWVLQKKIIFVLCVIGLSLWLWGVHYPYVGIYNANNNYLSLAAKNYLRFGFLHLKFFPTYFAGNILPSPIPYYLHHPILIFPLSAIPYIFFGFHNWVVHVTNFLFLLGDIFLLYKIAYLVWNKKVALWVLGLSTIFPMTSFFWKYIFFEQSSLFFNLCVYYCLLRYVAQKKFRYLQLIFVFTFLSGLVDWGVLYLFLPFIALFFTKFNKVALRPFMLYLLATGISLSFFIGSVYVLQNGFSELGGVVLTRSYNAELTKLSLWPIRLALISILRIVLYFTPFAAMWVMAAVGIIKRKKDWRLQEITIVFFFLFGSLNLIFLPTATWGHSYFLFYFIPLFSFLGGLWFAKIEKNTILFYSALFVMVISSIGVNYLKIEQVRKQLWKYDVAVQIHSTLIPYETIGVVNFAGDVLENYFLHPSQPMSYDQLLLWIQGVAYPELHKAIYVCEGTCTGNELRNVDTLKLVSNVAAYNAGGNSAWLVVKNTRYSQQKESIEEIITPNVQTTIKEDNIFLRIYRFFRDTLNVGQI